MSFLIKVKKYFTGSDQFLKFIIDLLLVMRENIPYLYRNITRSFINRFLYFS